MFHISLLSFSAAVTIWRPFRPAESTSAAAPILGTASCSTSVPRWSTNWTLQVYARCFPLQGVVVMATSNQTPSNSTHSLYVWHLQTTNHNNFMTASLKDAFISYRRGRTYPVTLQKLRVRVIFVMHVILSTPSLYVIAQLIKLVAVAGQLVFFFPPVTLYIFCEQPVCCKTWLSDWKMVSGNKRLFL